MLVHNKEKPKVTEAERLLWDRRAAGYELFTFMVATIFIELFFRVLSDSILMYALITYHNVLLRVWVKLMTLLFIFPIGDLAGSTAYYVITKDSTTCIIDLCMISVRVIIYLVMMSLVNSERKLIETVGTSQHQKFAWARPVQRSAASRSKTLSRTPPLGRNSSTGHRVSPMRQDQGKGSAMADHDAKGKIVVASRVKFTLPIDSDEDAQRREVPSNKSTTSIEQTLAHKAEGQDELNNASSILKRSDKYMQQHKQNSNQHEEAFEKPPLVPVLPSDTGSPPKEMKKPPQLLLLEWKPWFLPAGKKKETGYKRSKTPEKTEPSAQNKLNIETGEESHTEPKGLARQPKEQPLAKSTGSHRQPRDQTMATTSRTNDSPPPRTGNSPQKAAIPSTTPPSGNTLAVKPAAPPKLKGAGATVEPTMESSSTPNPKPETTTVEIRSQKSAAPPKSELKGAGVAVKRSDAEESTSTARNPNSNQDRSRPPSQKQKSNPTGKTEQPRTLN